MTSSGLHLSDYLDTPVFEMVRFSDVVRIKISIQPASEPSNLIMQAALASGCAGCGKIENTVRNRLSSLSDLRLWQMVSWYI
jgi:hypothetical protein